MESVAPRNYRKLVKRLEENTYFAFDFSLFVLWQLKVVFMVGGLAYLFIRAAGAHPAIPNLSWEGAMFLFATIIIAYFEGSNLRPAWTAFLEKKEKQWNKKHGAALAEAERLEAEDQS